jgi:murein DD-endopeptidase MepM/ murein hydrolase activator NlpD
LRFFLFYILLTTAIFASSVHNFKWDQGKTLLDFLYKHKITHDAYFELSKTDKELCSEIIAGIEYQVMFDDQNIFKQALIPISDQMQLHIFKNQRDKFEIDIIPIMYKEETEVVVIPLDFAPYSDIEIATKNKELANEFLRTFNQNIDFKAMQKGDLIAIKYKNKKRLGKNFGVPEIIGSVVKTKRKKYSMFKNDYDGRYYDEKGRSLTSFFLKVPLRYKRISSKFTLKRWHPILKKYRAHLGVDYAAPVGRYIRAAADGKVIFKGRRGGYGKTIMIRHKNGYKTLYAHMNGYARNIRVGSWVKQGRHIGYVGSTGRSTGPHLHFGLYKNDRAINPLKILKVVKNRLKGKDLRQYKKSVKLLKEELYSVI